MVECKKIESVMYEVKKNSALNKILVYEWHCLLIL